LAQRMENFVVIELDADGRLVGTVNDGRDTACAAKAAARTRSLYAARCGVEFHELLREGGITRRAVSAGAKMRRRFFARAATSPGGKLTRRTTTKPIRRAKSAAWFLPPGRHTTIAVSGRTRARLRSRECYR